MLGSPPHTRGISKLYTAGNGRYRFTPAYAGNIKALTECSCKYQVHPRIRGEYLYSIIITSFILGSPPHTRGIFWNCRFFLVFFKVHPRIRGEYLDSPLSPHPDTGSPPHTRGIFNLNTLDRQGLRFTPAYAGNIFVLLRAEGSLQVHPRIRGEYNSKIRFVS